VAKQTASTADLELADEIARFYYDPLGFVRFAYPWREIDSPLANYDGPDEWQTKFLIDWGKEIAARRFDGVHSVDPIRMAVASGHDCGKTTLSAWIVDFIMSTRPYCKGTITANTYKQLETKTWSAIRTWTAMCITSHWFEVSSDKMYHRSYPSKWFCSAQSCREENSEAFAGQHAAESTSFYLFDEGSAVSDKLLEVSEGGLADGEPMIFLLGNPTRSTGKLYRVVFGSERNRWNSRVVDSRTSAISNKKLIDEWIADYGEDSDFVRVRVRGLPPKASDLQYIPSDRVFAAQKRPPQYLPDDPLIVGVDVARGGGDNNVIRFRRGNDASSIPPIKIPGEESRDSMRLVSVILDVLNKEYYTDTKAPVKPTAAFVDGTGIGGPLVDRCRQMGHKNVFEVQFGSRSPDPHYSNFRAYIWSKMREWLNHGSIDSDQQLEIDLTAPGYRHDKKDRLLLESKEDMKRRGLASTDDADSLATTFSQPVGPTTTPSALKKYTGSLYLGDYQSAWMA
jgi:hypothetical protein